MKDIIKRHGLILWVLVIGVACLQLSVYGAYLPDIPIKDGAYSESLINNDVGDVYHSWGAIWLGMCTIFAGTLAVFKLIDEGTKNEQ